MLSWTFALELPKQPTVARSHRGSPRHPLSWRHPSRNLDPSIFKFASTQVKCNRYKGPNTDIWSLWLGVAYSAPRSIRVQIISICKASWSGDIISAYHHHTLQVASCKLPLLGCHSGMHPLHPSVGFSNLSQPLVLVLLRSFWVGPPVRMSHCSPYPVVGRILQLQVSLCILVASHLCWVSWQIQSTPS